MASDDNKAIPDLKALRMQIPLRIEAFLVPLHEGIALVLEAKQLGVTQWPLTKEQCQALVQALNQSLQDLDG